MAVLHIHMYMYIYVAFDCVSNRCAGLTKDMDTHTNYPPQSLLTSLIWVM